MTTKLDPKKIALLLTQSSRQLNTGTLTALSKARQNALKRQSARAPAYVLSTGRWSHGLISQVTRHWLVTSLLVAVLLATSLLVISGYWQHSQGQKISEIDVAILTDDLPIEVFID